MPMIPVEPPLNDETMQEYLAMGYSKLDATVAWLSGYPPDVLRRENALLAAKDLVKERLANLPKPKRRKGRLTKDRLLRG